MQRIATIILFLIAVYALPLAANPSKILTLEILFLVGVAVTMLATQPTPKLEEARKHKSSDRYSFHAILLGAVLSQITCVIEWAYAPVHLSGIASIIVTAIGATLAISGLAIRIWAIRTLGPLFTATVQITRGHVLVTSGPYAFVRHPSYLGAYLAFVGAGLVLGAPIGTAITAAAMFAIYRFRISAEEATLSSEFGRVYASYAQNTKRLIPLVW